MSNKVLENATAHFRNRISGEMRKIHVPEWQCDIWFKESNSLKDEGKLIELAQQGKTVEALVESLIIKARNQDGSKMFTNLDRVVFLNEVDPQIVIRVVSDMGTAAAADSDGKEVEKN
jgi:hypothetical protein